MGDQFIALMKVAEPHKDRHRHFAVVVDDRSRVKELIELAGGTFAAGPFLDFFDPWGNRVEVVEYTNIQFTKASHVLRGMGLDLAKNDKALHMAYDLLRGTQVNSAFPPNAKNPVPN